MKSMKFDMQTDCMGDWDLYNTESGSRVPGGVCTEYLKEVFPNIDWSDDDQEIVCTLSRSRRTGFKTFRIVNEKTMFGYTLRYGRSRETVYLLYITTAWLERQDIIRNGVFYVKMEVK